MTPNEPIIDQQGRMCYGPKDALLPSHQIFDYVLTNKLRFEINCPGLESDICRGTGEVCIFKRGLKEPEESKSPIILVGAAAGDLILDQTAERIIKSPFLEKGHAPIELNPLHWNALLTLTKNAGEFVNVVDIYRGAIANDKINTDFVNVPNTVSQYFVFVRKLLEQPKNARIPLIQTQRGAYRLLMPQNLVA